MFSERPAYEIHPVHAALTWPLPSLSHDSTRELRDKSIGVIFLPIILQALRDYSRGSDNDYVPPFERRIIFIILIIIVC